MARRQRYLGPFAYHLGLFAPTVDQLDLADFDVYAQLVDGLLPAGVKAGLGERVSGDLPGCQ